MKLVFVGSGNTATVLAKKFYIAGHSILQVCSRNLNHAHQLATATDAQPIDQLSEISRKADLVILAVADQVLPEISSQLQFGDLPVVHTAGSVSREVLHSSSDNYGVLYPLQSLRKEMDPLCEIPFLVDAVTPQLLQQLQHLTLSVSQQVQQANDGQRLSFHFAAVLVNNFTNHLYALAHQFCSEQKADFQLLLPLIQETALRLKQAPPELLQTGPARRHDQVTIQRHLDLLEANQPLQQLYSILTDSIFAMYAKNEELRDTNSPL
jgi:predicted short-subunit dehydrogenase-like oxidoreductase (DUF2520 family)